MTQPPGGLLLWPFEARYAAGDTSLTEVLPVRRERIAALLAHLAAVRDVMEAWAGLSVYLAK